MTEQLQDVNAEAQPVPPQTQPSLSPDNSHKFEILWFKPYKRTIWIFRL